MIHTSLWQRFRSWLYLWHIPAARADLFRRRGWFGDEPQTDAEYDERDGHA